MPTTPLSALSGVDILAAQQAAVAGDLPGLQAALTTPTEALVHQVLERALPTRAKAQFLLKHADFVRGHLLEVFERFEGSAGCGDKAAWAFALLLRRFLKHPAGKPDHGDAGEGADLPGIRPVRVLQSDAALLEAFRAIEHLYHGQAFSYLEWVSRVGRSLKAMGSDAAVTPASTIEPVLLH